MVEKTNWLSSFVYFKKHLYVTLFFLALPFFLYWIERSSGALPSPESWEKTGYNHGPWRYELEGLLFWVPIYFVSFFTLVTAVWTAALQRKISYLIWGITIALLQFILLLLLPFVFLGWTID